MTFPVCQWLARTAQSPQNVYADRVLLLPSLLHQAQTAMSPIMSRRRAESSLEIETVRASCKAPEAGTAPSA